jgi:hypothetical protein
MIELKISFDPATKQVQVNGPIGDKMLAYALLGYAHDLIRDYCDLQAKQGIIAPALFTAPPSNGRG